MYCLKCRRVTETENITFPTSKNGRLMKPADASRVEKLNVNLLKRMLVGGVFSILW